MKKVLSLLLIFISIMVFKNITIFKYEKKKNIKHIGVAYYFKSNGLIKKEIIDDKNKKDFNRYLNADNNVFAISLDGKVYSVDDDGVLQRGIVKIDDDKYYFDKNGLMQKGIVEIKGKKYVFDEKSGKLSYGFVIIDEKTYYVETNGNMVHGFADINGNRYYFDNEGVMQKGIINVNDNNYYFDNDGILKTGFIDIDDNTYYANEEGILQKGLIDIEGKTYYFNEEGIMVIGWKNINGNDYFFKYDGSMAKEMITMNNKEYYFNNDGILKYIVNLPYYFSQKDYRWAGITYGNANMALSGCGPTSLAMIFSSIKGYYISPNQIANYLYNNTDEFNKYNIGMSGRAVIYAASAYGINYVGVNSLDDLNYVLNQGKMVLAFVSEGHFVKSGYTHAIVVFKEKGDTVVYNPNGSYGWKRYIDSSIVWNERSTDPYDLNGGNYFYAFG